MKTFLILLILCPFILFSQSADEIIHKAEDAIKGESSQGTITMRIVTPDYTREMRMKSWWVGNEKALIVILSPQKDKGNKTLKIKNEMWSYLKNTETTIKIPPSMMLQSWNGSDFTNDDLVRETNLNRDYEIKLMHEEAIAGELSWKIELKPKPDVPVVWGTIYYWVRKKDFLPALVQYYSEAGELVRTMKFMDFGNTGGRLIPRRWAIISNKKQGHYTEMLLEDVQFDVKIPDKIFSFRELEK
jgi:outer membrane lipoprotein-sorting protein